jgi:Tfp pilus assembly protein PilF
MMPVALLLVEYIFFQTENSRFVRTIRYALGACALGVLGFIIVWEMADIKVNLPLTGGYLSRPFSLTERLLTEPRVVLYYLSQLFYPVPSRLSIAHDVVISTSLFEPAITLPAILTLSGIIGLGMFFIRKQPLASFGVLFFFLNHIVESSFIPLELVFEHRNYLPSLFLFVPIAQGFFYTCRYFKSHGKVVAERGVLGLSMLLLVLWGCGTFVRNMAWHDKKTLWQDAMYKAPDSARPLGVLAIELAWGEGASQGRQRLAVKMFEKALSLEKARDQLDAEIMGNIAGIYFNQGLYDKAIKIYRKAIRRNPFFLKARYDNIKALFMLHMWDKASKEADELLAGDQRYVIVDYFNIKGYILLWQDNPASALPYFRKALEMEPVRPDVLLNTGVALTRMECFRQGRWFLQQALKKSDDKIRVYFSLIENRLKADDSNGAKICIEDMLAIQGPSSIVKKLEETRNSLVSAPVDVDLVLPVVVSCLTQEAPDRENTFHHDYNSLYNGKNSFREKS